MSTDEHYTWFITGTSRGIGLEMTKQLLQSPQNIVVASCRNPEKAESLQSLKASAGGRLHIVRLDVTNTQTIEDAAEATSRIVGKQGIDYLINNVGIEVWDNPFSVDLDDLMRVFRTTVAGPAFVSQTFAPLLEKGKKKTIINITSTGGSIGSDLGAFAASYTIAKAGLNMLTYKQAKIRPEFTVVALCPGALDTDMGRSADIDIPTLPVFVGVAAVIQVIISRTLEDSGLFFNFKGERVPW